MTQPTRCGRSSSRRRRRGPAMTCLRVGCGGLDCRKACMRTGTASTGVKGWRERKACFGMMVQLDGSHHDWFEGRRVKAVLMVMVDDATNEVWAQFFEEETTRASYDVFEGCVRGPGLPQSLYADRDSIYRCEGVGSVAEQLAGQGPQTQFGRAMAQVGGGWI